MLIGTIRSKVDSTLDLLPNLLFGDTLYGLYGLSQRLNLNICTNRFYSQIKIKTQSPLYLSDYQSCLNFISGSKIIETEKHLDFLPINRNYSVPYYRIVLWSWYAYKEMLFLKYRYAERQIVLTYAVYRFRRCG